MPRYRIQSFKTFILLLVLVYLSTAPVLALQTLVLDELNPDTKNLSAFNSFKHHLLILAITKKNKSPFDCQENKYVFYDYRDNVYFEILAGNLKINGDYSKIFKTKIHSLGVMPVRNKGEWKKNVQTLLANLNVSSQTLESGKIKSSDGTMSCWQQPEVMTLSPKKTKTYPFLAANLCKNSWCSELYWLNSSSIQFWIQIKPKEYHLIRLNTKTGVHQFQKTSSKFYQKKPLQLNAPRDNLVTDKNIEKGQFVISSQKNKGIKLLWSTQKNGRIKATLVREHLDKKASNKVQKQIHQYVDNRQYTEAFQLLKFGFWLNPENKELKLERLRIYASLLQLDGFFNSLQSDFNESDRFYACQQMHLDNSLKNLWKQKSFSNKFKKICL